MPPDLHRLVVQKYGGSSLKNPERINAVADRVARAAANHALVVVVSFSAPDRQTVNIEEGRESA